MVVGAAVDIAAAEVVGQTAVVGRLVTLKTLQMLSAKVTASEKLAFVSDVQG